MYTYLSTERTALVIHSTGLSDVLYSGFVIEYERMLLKRSVRTAELPCTSSFLFLLTTGGGRAKLYSRKDEKPREFASALRMSRYQWE
jgi:hypothetical protein